jgi:hypothetical protein
MINETAKLEHEIADTRVALEETVEALAYKTDIGARTQDAIDENIENVKENVDRSIHNANEIVHGSIETVRGGSRQPLVVLLGAIAVGAVVGALLPLSPIEREKFGGIDSQVRKYAKNSATDLIARGRTLLLEVFRAS